MRPAKTDDVAGITVVANDASLDRIASFVARQTHWWAAHGYGLWVLQLRSNMALVGWCGLRPGDDASSPEVLYGLAESSRGAGLATEALKAVINFALEIPNVSSIWAATAIGNVASAAVMRRGGMTFEKRALLDGVDSYIYRYSRGDS
jgi:[ribosomal protein S5]-alanine N-acetyltransferase